MPITKNGQGVIVETPLLSKDQFEATGVVRADEFAICDGVDRLKQLKFDTSAQTSNTSVTFASGANASNIILTLPATSGTLAMSGASGITALTGDVTASGTGSVAATVAAINGTTVAGASSANTANNLVLRDGTGAFSAGVISATSATLTNGTPLTLQASPGNETITASTGSNMMFFSFVFGSEKGVVGYNATDQRVFIYNDTSGHGLFLFNLNAIALGAAPSTYASNNFFVEPGNNIAYTASGTKLAVKTGSTTSDFEVNGESKLKSLVQGYQYATPTVGSTTTANGTTSAIILDPAGTIATATLVLPTSPHDGFILEIVPGTNTITTLTISPGGGDSITGAITTLVTGAAGAGYIYRSTNTRWYRQY